MKLLLGILLLVSLVWASKVEASCSGGGLTWSCTAGSTTTQVQTAVDSAGNGATITFAAGTYTFGIINLDARNGITLVCATAPPNSAPWGAATVNPCTISSNGDHFKLGDGGCAATKTNLMRVSGFRFTGTPNTGIVWFYCGGGGNLEQVRVDHNTFTNFSGSQATFFGEPSQTGYIYGVVDHNNFAAGNNGMAMKNISGGTNWITGRRGTANNLFFEDNTISAVTNTNLGLSGVDVWRANGTVLRYNTVMNTRLESHSLCHGGPTNFEVYHNTINDTSGGQYRNLHSQGSGEIIWFSNIIESAGDGNAMALQHYRSDGSQMPQGDCTAAEIANGTFTASSGIPQTDGNRPGGFGYPAWHQPGRDADGTLKPVYAWDNHTASGTRLNIDVQSGSWTGNLVNCANTNTNRINCHIVTNRDIYQAPGGVQTSSTSPFNGTVGVGFGTLARRPTTCTAGPGGLDEDNGGVAYFATDQGAQGTLYRCQTTDAWVIEYTPYTYPHPLVGGGGSEEPPSTSATRRRSIS